MRQTATTPNTRTLYFDIDGVVLGYDDVVKPALADGRLEAAVRAAGFARLVCVSGWVDLLRSDVLRLSIAHQHSQLHRLLSEAFPDRKWFLSSLSTIRDTDHRCQSLDLSGDWYYCDDWADKFFVEAHGADKYAHELGRRVLLVDPHGDGTDVLQWLDRVGSQGQPS